MRPQEQADNFFEVEVCQNMCVVKDLLTVNYAVLD